MILLNALNKPPGLFSWCSLHFHKDRLLTTLAFSYMWVEFNLSFTYSPQWHRWEKPEPEGISHPGQGSQAGRHFQTKRRGRWHSWKIRLLVWPASASHRDNGITDNCLRGICCCSNTSLIWHTRASHILSLPFSPTYLMPVLISIFPCQIHMACTHTHTQKISTHPHTLTCTDNICKRKAAETGGLVKLLLSDLSVLVRSSDMCDLWVTECLKGPYLTELLSQCVSHHTTTAVVVCTTPLSSEKQQRSVCFVDTTVSQSF